MIKLNDYTLMFDGSIVIEPSNIFSFVPKVPTSKIQLTELTPDLIKYNSMCRPSERLRVFNGEKVDLLPIRWMFDSEIQKMSDNDLFRMICVSLAEKSVDKDDEYRSKAVNRVKYEWELFKKNNFINLLRSLLSVINNLTNKEVCWGPGRGSSTSSYILYLIGLHDVDCIEYDVDIHDFIKR